MYVVECIALIWFIQKTFIAFYCWTWIEWTRIGESFLAGYTHNFFFFLSSVALLQCHSSSFAPEVIPVECALKIILVGNARRSLCYAGCRDRYRCECQDFLFLSFLLVQLLKGSFPATFLPGWNQLDELEKQLKIIYYRGISKQRNLVCIQDNYESYLPSMENVTVKWRLFRWNLTVGYVATVS